MKKKTKQDFQELIKTEHGDRSGHAWLLLLPPCSQPQPTLKRCLLALWDAASC